jgi:hypothetical protein
VGKTGFALQCLCDFLAEAHDPIRLDELFELLGISPQPFGSVVCLITCFFGAAAWGGGGYRQGSPEASLIPKAVSQFDNLSRLVNEGLLV